MKDLLTSATESALAVQQGDLEIAANQLKISGWLATISTAGLYFCFNGDKHHVVNLSNHFSHPLFYPHVAISLVFGLSLIAAYEFHVVHNLLFAYSKNAVCGYKIQLAAALQKIEEPACLNIIKSEPKLLWAFVTAGELLKLLDPNDRNIIEDTLNKIARFRDKVDAWLALQKRLTLFGFLSLIVANAYFAV
ncbi:hypothetical protein [Nevskia sp.]|uniref:hypothetical protein n=1 Tax=Nevskia sp. TaxID=1929292 RepID=UPI0025CF430C|nr:hypothetical protein [Nevskia sp.]